MGEGSSNGARAGVGLSALRAARPLRSCPPFPAHSRSRRRQNGQKRRPDDKAGPKAGARDANLPKAQNATWAFARRCLRRRAPGAKSCRQVVDFGHFTRRGRTRAHPISESARREAPRGAGNPRMGKRRRCPPLPFSAGRVLCRKHRRGSLFP